MNLNIVDLTTAEHLDDPRPNYTIVSIDRCCEADFEGDEREETKLVALMIGIKTASQNDTNGGITMAPYRQLPSGARQRLNGPAHSYNRLCSFIDLSSPGRTFDMIFQHNGQIIKQFELFTATQEGVGHAFVMEEPEQVTSYIGGVIPILPGAHTIRPLSNPLTDLLPQAPIQRPPLGETRYFSGEALHGLTIYNTRVTIPGCNGGRFCDAQKLLNPKQKCGCFFGGSSPSLVVRADIRLPDQDPSFDARGTVVVRGVMSKKLTSLIVHPGSIGHLARHAKHLEPQVRQAARDVFAHVSANGGWTYVGWVKAGQVSDEGNDERNGEAIANHTMTTHLSVLQPTNEAILDTPAFNACRLRLDAEGNVL